jgi:hypothetical protein
MKVEVGKTYIYNGKTVKCTAKWAQGVHFTYTFDDGSSFNGDAEAMFASGELKAVSGGSVGDGSTVEKHQRWQAPLSHPTQKEDREAGRGKTAKP